MFSLSKKNTQPKPTTTTKNPKTKTTKTNQPNNPQTNPKKQPNKKMHPQTPQLQQVSYWEAASWHAATPKTQTHPQPAHCTAVCYALERCVCILNSPRISSVVSALHPFTASVSKWVVYQQLDAWACASLCLLPTHCAWKYLGEPTAGMEMFPPPQNCSAQGTQEKQPKWWDYLVLRHH